MPGAETAFHLSGVTPLKGKIRKMRDGAQTNERTRCRESLLRHNTVWLWLQLSAGDIMSCVMPAKVRN